MLRTVLAVIAGYAVMVILVLVAHAFLTSAGLLLTLGVIAAFIGGLVAAKIKSLKAALYLAILILLLSIPAFFIEGAEPLWYQLLRTTLAPIGVVLGGLLLKSPPAPRKN